MRTIQLKDFTVSNGSKNITINTRQLLESIINTPLSQGGFNVSDMHIRLRLLDKVKSLPSDSTQIDFEENDIKLLAACSKNTRWAIVSKEIVDFVEDLANNQ